MRLCAQLPLRCCMRLHDQEVAASTAKRPGSVRLAGRASRRIVGRGVSASLAVGGYEEVCDEPSPLEGMRRVGGDGERGPFGSRVSIVELGPSRERERELDGVMRVEVRSDTSDRGRRSGSTGWRPPRRGCARVPSAPCVRTVARQPLRSILHR
jgi:hypothetical protein